MLVVERRPPEGVDVDVGGGLGKGDLARRRAGGERAPGPRRSAPRSRRGRSGRHAPPWQVPRQAWLARLRSSSSVKPRSQAAWRSATVVPMQPQTTPSVGAGGSGSVAAASPTTRTGTSPAIRASRSRGARPSPRTTVSAGVVVVAPVAGSAVMTARTRPSTPSKRTSRPATLVAGTPSGGSPTATVRPRSTPAAWSFSAARAVTSPASRLPGQTGWISAAPVATTISCAWTWSIPRSVRTTMSGPA